MPEIIVNDYIIFILKFREMTEKQIKKLALLIDFKAREKDGSMLEEYKEMIISFY